jgi:hypothetical protein
MGLSQSSDPFYPMESPEEPKEVEVEEVPDENHIDSLEYSIRVWFGDL